MSPCQSSVKLIPDETETRTELSGKATICLGRKTSTYIAICQGGIATSGLLVLAMLALGLLCLPCLISTAPRHQQLHKLMNDREKQFYFGEEEPTEYEVIEVFRPTPENELSRDTRDVHFHAMGQQFKLKLSPNKRLMAPQVYTIYALQR